jgi:hypothetical protein
MSTSIPIVRSIADFGGVLVEREGWGITDPTTDRPVAGVNTAFADIAMMTHTQIAAIASIQWQDASSTGMKIAPFSEFRHDSTWGADTSVIPDVVRMSAGTFEIRWPETVVDELGETRTVTFGRAFASAHPGTFNTWSASTASSLNDLVVPTAANGFLYKCTTAGTRGASEPTWPTTLTNTVADGSVVWTCIERLPYPCGYTATVTASNVVTVRTFAIPGGALADVLACGITVFAM